MEEQGRAHSPEETRKLGLKQEVKTMSAAEQELWEEQIKSLTPTDLALIAANLGQCQGRPDSRALEAYDLWFACARRIRLLRLQG